LPAVDVQLTGAPRPQASALTRQSPRVKALAPLAPAVVREFLAAQTLIAQSNDVGAMRAAAVQMLARLPEVSGAAARLDGDTATDGLWEHDVGDGLCTGFDGDAAYLCWGVTTAVLR
jgi:hypothetical protein